MSTVIDQMGDRFSATCWTTWGPRRSPLGAACARRSRSSPVVELVETLAGRRGTSGSSNRHHDCDDVSRPHAGKQRQPETLPALLPVGRNQKRPAACRHQRRDNTVSV